MKKCVKCNLSYNEDKSFCKKCGSPLTSEYQIDPKNAAKKSVFEDRLRLDPLNIEILHEYVQFLINNLIFKEAVTVSLKILAINENDGVANQLLFKSYIKLSMFKDALEIGKQLLEENPTDLSVLKDIAEISYKQGNYDKANEYFDKILFIQPSNVSALYNKSLTLLEKNQLEEALEIFKGLYLEGNRDRITVIYTGISNSLNSDYKEATELLIPIMSDDGQIQNDLKNSRGFLYLAYSLCQTQAGLNEIEKWAAKINLKILKQNHHLLDEQTYLKTIEFIVNQSLNEIVPSSAFALSQYMSLTKSYLDNGYFTANSKQRIAELWYAVGNMQAESKHFSDAVISFQKAIDLSPGESRYKEKHAESKKTVEDAKNERSKKTKKVIVTLFVALFVALVIIAVSISAYNNFRDKASWNEAKSLNSVNGYNNYLSGYPKGKYATEASDSILSKMLASDKESWNEAKSLNTLDSYKNYLSSYPNGKYTTDANEGILANMLAMVSIKGGTFKMGSNDGYDSEKPVHTVTLSDFYMGKYEVSQALWESVMGNNPSRFKGADLPVEQVSWDDVQEFLNKLSKQTGKIYNLPTEAQWEYAAGGGASASRTLYAGTSSEGSLGNYAWFTSNSNNTTHAVGSKQLDGLGLYDMSGNVWEWCSDWYGEYSGDAQTNPAGASTGSSRVLRGGSWYDGVSICRVSSRRNFAPGGRAGDGSFRLVLVP